MRLLEGRMLESGFGVVVDHRSALMTRGEGQ